MSPRKRKANVSVAGDQPESNKRLSRVDREKLICKRRLDELEQAETFTTDDRFSSKEKQRLLEAYNKCGYNVFQDMKLLHEFLPNRRESDLRGLLDRLRINLLANQKETSVKEETRESCSRGDTADVDNIREWQRLCQNLMGIFARDNKVNLDDVVADSLFLVSNELKIQCKGDRMTTDNIEGKDSPGQVNYEHLLKCFSQLLSGKFPDNMSASEARVSIRLFDHVNSMAETLNSDRFSSLLDGTWLEKARDDTKMRQEMATTGLEDWKKLAKGTLTLRDVEKNQSIEALCLELPKIKRITEVLNPLRINESLVSGLMDL